VVTITIMRPVDEVATAWGESGVAGELAGQPVHVDFSPAPVGRGTELRARVGPDGGDGNGAGLAERLQGEAPGQRLRDALRRFKSTTEAGEVITTEGQPSGRSAMAEGLLRAVSRRLRAWSGP
jgi:hypothetical protein